jgi:hypothetical protein
MKLKSILVSIVLALSSVCSFASDGTAALLGIVIGSQLQLRPPHPYVYTQPTPYPYVYVRPYTPPVVISPLQAPYYDPELYGYCAPYQDMQYAYCIDNIRRKKFDDAYRHRYGGY